MAEIPIGFLEETVIANTELFTVEGAGLYHFGVLSSAMHMVWVRSVCGRLESRYRYSKDIVYNNFPWPEALTDRNRKDIEDAAQGVLDARANFPDSSLADLYNLLTMPPELVRAHQALDNAVDIAYSRRRFSGDGDRVSLLFNLYQQKIAPLDTGRRTRRTRKT